MLYPQAKILLFAKAPIIGKVKTRLIPDIGAMAAADLHKSLVEHALDSLCAADLCPIELWCAPDCDDPFFLQCQDRYGVKLKSQRGEELGQKMHHALMQNSGNPTLLMGGDVPSITIDHLTQALGKLTSTQGWLFIPTEDGGYGMVGCCRSDSRMFRHIEWGSENVMEQTLKQAAKISVSPILLDKVWDVDDVEDFRRWQVLKGIA